MHKRRFNSKIHLAVEAHGLPLRIVITAGTRADCSKAHRPIEGLDAANLLADKGYDIDAIVEACEQAGMKASIPPKRHCHVQREYDHDIYRERQLVENVFEKRNRWRGIATRYAERTASFLAAVPIRCLVIWHRIS